MSLLSVAHVIHMSRVLVEEPERAQMSLAAHSSIPHVLHVWTCRTDQQLVVVVLHACSILALLVSHKPSPFGLKI